jgi:hypothetical protein
LKETFYLAVVGVGVRVDCEDPQAGRLLQRIYGAMIVGERPYALHYRVGLGSEGAFRFQRDGQAVAATTVADFLYDFEKDLTIQVELLRSDLLFIHAAAVARNGRAHIIAAPSGTGKSTTSWALLKHGFRYLSDELAPIDLDAMAVVPYPHALCLKAEPPEQYALPAGTVPTERTLHVPIPAPGTGHPDSSSDPVPLASLLFLDYRPDEAEPSMTPISAAEAAARLYSNTLNALAHGREGMEAVMQVVTGCRSHYRLTSTELNRTCEMLAGFADLREGESDNDMAGPASSAIGHRRTGG